jgi:translin
VDNLDNIAEKILSALEQKHSVREATLQRSRRLIQHAARAIRAVHREDWEEAQALLQEAGDIAADLRQATQDHPDIYFTGYAQDALKEYAEAHITYALIAGDPIPDPDELQVEYPAYLNALGEAAGELRRHALDLIRRDQVSQAEEVLAAMDEIYGVLITVDYPDAITSGLRRTTDMVRGVVERTRGDLTTAYEHRKLQAALKEFEERIG